MPQNFNTLRQKSRFFLILCDFASVISSLLLSYLILSRFSTSIGLKEGNLFSESELLVAAVALVASALQGGQSVSQLIAGLQLYSSALRTSTQTLMVAALAAYALGIDARPLLVTMLVIFPLTLIVGRWTLRQILRWLNRNQESLPVALLIGAHSDLELNLKRDGSIGFRPISIPNARDVAEVTRTIISSGASAVVLDRQLGNAREFRDLVWQAEDLGCKVMVSSPIGLMAPNDIAVLPTASHDLLVLSSASLRLSSRFVKRTFDLLVAPLLALATAPFLLLGMALIFLSGERSVFYKGARVGAKGQNFEMYKLRTMKTGIEQVGSFEVNKESLTEPKANSDLVTPVGKFLRRWSIDELPQLFQVISGTMSLVGPRPRLPGEHNESLILMRRLKVKPGLTGLWQISGRGDMPLNEAAELDVRYVDSWSMFSDVAIILRTLKTVITGRGAR
jgi:lipopolysaccharide/colanic/teichoic acid biosynthesis glycosyltransferase